MTRTFSRADWVAAQQAWADGEFSHEWRAVRHQAALRGILYPPSGSKWDSWGDDEPSQRAIVIRAIRETPGLLTECIARSRSWSDVIAALIRRRDDWREEMALAESRARQRRAEEGPTDREAPAALRAILERIGNS